MLSTSSHMSVYGADCARIKGRCRAVNLSAEAESHSSFYDHSLASASAQALLPRGSHYLEEGGEARNQLVVGGMFAQEFCRF